MDANRWAHISGLDRWLRRNWTHHPRPHVVLLSPGPLGSSPILCATPCPFMHTLLGHPRAPFATCCAPGLRQRARLPSTPISEKSQSRKHRDLSRSRANGNLINKSHAGAAIYSQITFEIAFQRTTLIRSTSPVTTHIPSGPF